jgi:hypothetical protein
MSGQADANRAVLTADVRRHPGVASRCHAVRHAQLGTVSLGIAGRSPEHRGEGRSRPPRAHHGTRTAAVNSTWIARPAVSQLLVPRVVTGLARRVIGQPGHQRQAASAWGGVVRAASPRAEFLLTRRERAGGCPAERSCPRCPSMRTVRTSVGGVSSLVSEVVGVVVRRGGCRRLTSAAGVNAMRVVQSTFHWIWTVSRVHPIALAWTWVTSLCSHRSVAMTGIGVGNVVKRPAPGCGVPGGRAMQYVSVSVNCEPARPGHTVVERLFETQAVAVWLVLCK